MLPSSLSLPCVGCMSCVARCAWNSLKLAGHSLSSLVCSDARSNASTSCCKAARLPISDVRGAWARVPLGAKGACVGATTIAAIYEKPG